MRITGHGVWGPPSDRNEAIRVLRRAVELGIDFIDTADAYGPNVSEELIHEALHPYRHDGKHIVIATKAGLERPGPNQWVPNGKPSYLRSQCEKSLKRLGVEQIDLFQLHRIDPKVPADDQFGLLKALLDEGKVGAIGLSEVSVEEIERARKIVPITTVQNLYNVSNRQSERVLDYCEKHAIGFIPWYPIASGKLTEPGGALDHVAKETGATLSQVALAWLLRRSQIMLPIPGTSRVTHLEENCAADQVSLTDAQFATLSNAAA